MMLEHTVATYRAHHGVGLDEDEEQAVLVALGRRAAP
jgi:hypothetical protein